MQKPKHKEPTNYDHCCSCVPVLERRIKILKETIKVLEKENKVSMSIINELNEMQANLQANTAMNHAMEYGGFSADDSEYKDETYLEDIAELIKNHTK